MIERVISGGQTGADQAGWRAAKRFNLPTGGWMPKGFLAEDGKHPEFAELFGARETVVADYPTRTRANARDSDATIWFGSSASRGYACTRNACRVAGKTVFLVETRGITPRDVVDWLELTAFKVLNVAGNRESTSPGIGARTEAYLVQVFVAMGLREVPDLPVECPECAGKGCDVCAGFGTVAKSLADLLRAVAATKEGIERT